MTDDPWKDLAPPSAADAVNARRVDAKIPWNFFWARGVDSKCMLVVEHAVDSTPRGRIPKLKGVEVALLKSNREDQRMLVMKLLEPAHRDIFHKLCLDIVTGASDTKSEREAVEVTLARMWRWHHLLRGGSDGRLSPEEQKGLIGELLVIERHLLPELSALDAISSWCGPLGSPKDFEIGRVCIEAKARRGAATPYIIINSEHQLDDSGIDELFLHVVELDRAPSDAAGGFSLSDVAGRIREKIAEASDGAVIPFDDTLFAAGYRWEDDYSDFRWIEGGSHLYRIEAEFPRITASDLVLGVSGVKYSLSLTVCKPFHVADDVLVSALGGIHGN